MLARSLVLVMCFAAGAVLVARADRPEAPPARTTFAEFPFQIDDWRGEQQAPLADNILALLGVDDYLTRTYYRPDGSGIGLYVGYYASQRQGDAMHSPQNCLPGAGWEPVRQSMMPLTVQQSVAGGTQDIVVNRYVIQKGMDRQLVLYWYQGQSRVVASEYWAKFYLLKDAMRTNRSDGSLVRVMTPFSGAEGEAQAEQVITRFVKEMFPLLGQYIPA